MADIRSCRACADFLPLGPRAILQASASARILIASQAPGTKAHESGTPFADASGAQLRRWMNISTDEFYDESLIAIVPMAFCYPGKLPGSGDAPPRPECAPLWRAPLLESMPDLRLTLLIGTHAQTHVLGRGPMTQRVREFRHYLPGIFPLPHPSWRSRHWASQNPWFETDVLPQLHKAVRSAMR